MAKQENEYSLVLTPQGRVSYFINDTAKPPASLKRLASDFADSTCAGLFALAATKFNIPLPPTFSYWRDFASRYLTKLCRLTEVQAAPIAPPSESELASLLFSAPPMQGGEYLTIDLLQDIWRELDSWIWEQVIASDHGLSDWLKTNAPHWHQVGRVCFHLAENKRDPDFPFAFLATYAPGISAGGAVHYQPLGKALQEYAGEKNREALINLLSPVNRASEKIEFVKELVSSGDIFHPLAWQPEDAYRLLKNAELLEDSGLLVRLPDWWRKRPRPRVAITIGEKKKSHFGTDSMLDFKVDLALGDETLTEEELRQIMASEDGLAFIKGRWIEVDKERLTEAIEHWKQVEASTGGDGISFIEGMRLLAGASTELEIEGEDGGDTEDLAWSFVDAGAWLSETLTSLRDPNNLSTSGSIKGLKGTLRPYQKTGHNWLHLLSGLGLGACLADDMGLGKTIQIISLLLTLKGKRNKNEPARPSLLVLPASLLANWKAELERFAPSLSGVFLHTSEIDKADLKALSDDSSSLGQADVVLTTYGMLQRNDWLHEIDWRLVVLDEAQAIKNPNTRQTKAVKKLRADTRIALTGTPIENRLSDLWSLFDFICPGLLGSVGRFKNFIKDLEAREHDQFAPLRALIQPYVLRRLKTDKSIISDLPDKTEMKVFCSLAKRQAAAYANSVKELAHALDTLESMERRGLVLAFLLRLKQICNHPSQFLADGQYDPAHSGKFERLKVLCEEIASRQEKVLIFTQFREIIGPISTFLAEIFGREGLVLHGGTPVKKRQGLVKEFQKDDGPPFFVLSLKAGGTGLNLTAASHVIHFDRWWNPAVENQATDRAFRIGQQRNVVVHKFVCRGTIEEKIDALLEDKKDLADDILGGGGETMLTEMSNEELLKVVSLDIDRAAL
ncbi:MAG: DEAD/DEAH box helicase [Planctomycetes bacterium]|nr:DEAD/DEAH box helicase [Planctomycetota bacterium]